MRDEALIHFRPEERPFVKRLRNMAARVQQSGVMARTAFLTPREVRAAIAAVPSRDILFHVFGGYAQAERVRGCYSYEGDEPTPEDYHVVCLHTAFWSGDALPRHGDVLGSVLGLGVERDRIGDIAIKGADVFVFCTEEVAPFILGQWTKAGRASIAPRRIDLSEVPAFAAPNLEEKVFTLQSLRLDALVAHTFGLSRSKALAPIETGKVALNFVACCDPATEIAVDDIISLRGSGRARVLAVEGESRSGRTFIRIGRYV